MLDDGEERNPADQCGLVVSHQCLTRNKRCALAYMYVENTFTYMLTRISHHRTQKVKELRWQTGSVVPEHLAPA